MTLISRRLSDALRKRREYHNLIYWQVASKAPASPASHVFSNDCIGINKRFTFLIRELEMLSYYAADTEGEDE